MVAVLDRAPEHALDDREELGVRVLGRSAARDQPRAAIRADLGLYLPHDCGDRRGAIVLACIGHRVSKGARRNE